MAFIKKNPIFIVIVVLLLLVFGAGIFLAIKESAAVETAQQKASSSATHYRQLASLNPAPTVANVTTAEDNVAQLNLALGNIRAELQKGDPLTASTDGISVMTGLQRFIRDYRKIAESHTSDKGELAPVQLPANFGFGFERYIDRTEVPEDPDYIATLDKQRQILSYLMGRLIESSPHAINEVKRELIELPEERGRFEIDESVSARVPGAIDTLAFSITFTGYTESLRIFLNSLAQFELPIVVRSISVDRQTGRNATITPRAGAGDPFAGIFEQAQSESSDPLAGGGPMPVIDENVSTFTVILEFIEVVLPEGQTENLPDPA